MKADLWDIFTGKPTTKLIKVQNKDEWSKVVEVPYNRGKNYKKKHCDFNGYCETTNKDFCKMNCEYYIRENFNN